MITHLAKAHLPQPLQRWARLKLVESIKSGLRGPVLDSGLLEYPGTDGSDW